MRVNSEFERRSLYGKQAPASVIASRQRTRRASGSGSAGFEKIGAMPEVAMPHT